MPNKHRRRPFPSGTPYLFQHLFGLKQSVATGWHNLSGTEQTAFHALTLRLHPTPGGALPPGVNAFNTYSRLAHALFHVGRSSPDVCPPLEPAPVLPPLTLAASWTEAGKLSLLLSADEPCPLALALWGAKPILGGTTPAPSTRYGYIGFARAGTVGSTPFDAGSLYAVRYSVRSAGWQVGLRVMAVTASGFASAEQFVWASVG